MGNIDTQLNTILNLHLLPKRQKVAEACLDIELETKEAEKAIAVKSAELISSFNFDRLNEKSQYDFIVELKGSSEWTTLSQADQKAYEDRLAALRRKLGGLS